MRKASEDALRESESRFRAIFESAAVGIVRIAIDREGVLGKTIFSLMHADECEVARLRFEARAVSDTGGPPQVGARAA